MGIRNRLGKRRARSAMAYASERAIVLRGATPNKLGADTTSDVLRSVAWDDPDEAAGEAVLEVLRRYGGPSITGQDNELLAEFDVKSFGQMTREVDAASISLLPYYGEGEVRLSPYRRHPPGGWIASIDDPHYSCPPADVPAVGRLLKRAMEVARDLPPAR